MKNPICRTVPFEEVVQSRGSGNSGLAKSEWEVGGRFPVIGQGAEDIEGWTNREDLLLAPTSAVVLYGGHTRRSKYVSQPFVPGPNVKILEPTSAIGAKYLFYFLCHLPIESKGYADHFPLVKKSVVPVPSLYEQQRIVDILDEAFADLATVVSNAEKNLLNARALFESHLHSVFTGCKDEVRLSELATDITDGDHMPPPKAPSGIPFITISNIVKSTREIDFSDTFTVPKEYFENLKPNKKPMRGDVLYTVTGATLGIPVLVRQEMDFCFQRHIGLIRPKPNTDSEWLNYALLSPQVFRQATIGSTGAAQKTISLAVLRNIVVPKVDFSEQKKIARKISAIETEIYRLESLYRQKRAALEALKRSLLHQAFTGQL